MTRASRETVYGALFAKFQALQGLGVFKTVGRRLWHWTDVPRELQPALFQVQLSEMAKTDPSGVPVHWRLHLALYVYATTASIGASPSIGEAKSPAPLLNACLDAVETAFKPNVGSNRVDLGLPGQVVHCFIEGDIKTDEGVLGDQAVAIVPVIIVAV